MKIRIALFCLIGGLCFCITAFGNGHLRWSYLAGIALTAALTPVVRFGSRNFVVQAASLSFALIVIGLVCTMSEAVIFYPETKKTLASSLIGGSVMYCLAAIVLLALARLLRLVDQSEFRVEHRTVAWAISMVLLSGLSYVVYYMVFGGIAFQFFTKQYYPHAVEQVAVLGRWFWVYQLGRGVLMVLGTLPLIYTLRLPRWKAALAIGVLIWLGGGGAYLLVPNGIMATAQRYMHIVEIMTQNVSLGVSAVLLLRPRQRTMGVPVHSATAA